MFNFSLSIGIEAGETKVQNHPQLYIINIIY